MKYVFLFVLLGSIGVAPGWSQAGLSQAGLSQAGQTDAKADSETLHAILMEMRSLHNDVRLSQTTQILLTELEVEQTAVDRAMQKRDDAKVRMTQLQDNERNLAITLARITENEEQITDPNQKKQMEQAKENYKTNIASMKSQEPDRANEIQDRETAVRKEQDTLAGIQEQLDTVVKKMQPAVAP